MPPFEILKSPDRGRYVATTNPLVPGDIILQGAAYASAVCWDKRIDVCSNCLQECVLQRHCGNCKEIGYCSSDCQLSHRIIHNQEECSCIKTLELDVESEKLTFRAHELTILFLASRILRKLYHSPLSRNGELDQFFLSGEETTCDNERTTDDSTLTLNNENDISQSDIAFIRTCHHLQGPKPYDIEAQLDFIYKKALSMVGRMNCSRDEEKHISKQCFKKILLRLQMNAFDIVDDLQRTVGAGFFNLGAMCNHHCVPNTIMSYKRGKRIEQVLKAVRTLAVGEEVLVGYVDLIRSTGERRKILQETYGFFCDCSYCTNENGMREVNLETFNTVPAVLKSSVLNWNQFVITLNERATCQEKGVVDPDTLLDKDCTGNVVVGKDVLSILYKDSPIINNEALHALLERKCGIIDQTRADKDRVELFRCYKKTFDQLQHRFSLLNRSMYSMLSELFSLALEFNLDEYALVLCERIVFIQALVYHKFSQHPIRILQLQTYADLLLGQKRYQEGQDIYNNIIESLVLLLGKDHQFVAIAQQQITDAKRRSNS